ncbi:MAG: hypothetical protein AAGA42_14605 [Actinomycetota bacterium]
MANATGVGTAKDMIDLLEKLKAVAAGGEPVPAADLATAPWSEVTGPVGAADVSNSYSGAVAAVERFRTTMRWLVGVVGVIALVLFGSTAFTTDIDLGSWRVWAGLGLAGAGLVSVFYSVTRVMEPEDASLGELLADIRTLADSYPPVNDRKRSVAAYLEILRVERSAEPAEFVGGLITNIVEGAQSRVGPATELAERRAKLTELEAELTAVDARRAALTAALVAVVSNKDVPDVDKENARTAALPLIETAANRSSELAAHIADLRNDVAERASALQTIDVPLRTRLLDRELIINEYGVVQIRGTFRSSRFWLLTGAILTLLGTILYLSDIKGDDDSESKSSGSGIELLLPATLELSANDDAFVAVSAECKGVELGVLLGSLEVPGPRDAYDVVVVSPAACVGNYAIPKDTTGDQLDIQLP